MNPYPTGATEADYFSTGGAVSKEGLSSLAESGKNGSTSDLTRQRMEMSSSKSDLQQSLLNPFITDTTQTTLFHINAQQPSTFLKRRKASSGNALGNKGTMTGAIVTGINKLTFGGLDKVSSGFDKLKYIVKYPKEGGDGRDLYGRTPRSSKRIGSRRKDQDANDSQDEGGSPEKRKKPLSFKMSRSKKDFSISPTFKKLIPRTEGSRRTWSRDSEDSQDEGGRISDSALLREQRTESPSMGHRRMYSDATGLSHENSPYEAVPRLKEMHRIIEADVPSDVESEVSSVADMDRITSQQDLLENTQQFYPPIPVMTRAPSHRGSVSLYDYWKTFLYLYSEARLGPSKIGILDLSRYSHSQLEDSFLQLLDEVFDLSVRYNWMWTQTLFFARPVANHFARPIINR
jgi:hypothetical protein